MHTRIILALLVLSFPAFADDSFDPDAPVSSTVLQSPGEVHDYWTPERMREAKPMGMGRTMPAHPGGGIAVACTEEAMLCPDGSYVARGGPDCAFAPCPGGAAGTTPAQPPGAALQEPVTVEYLYAHRAALNGLEVTVRGLVTGALTGDKACPSTMGMCAQPRIFLADLNLAGVREPYNLLVLLPEGGRTSYSTGQKVEVTGIVRADSGSVMLMKNQEP